MNKRLICRTLIVSAIISLLTANLLNAQSANTLTPQEKADGWQLLFNGKNLDGWHSYLKDKPTKNWKAEDGAIVVTDKHNGEQADLVTDQEFENFDLKFEWKMEPCSNSGVMFYVHEDPKYSETYMTGPEMQIVDLACRYTSDHGEINDDII
ncbi:MAG: 3-keto-disaccharide hydrolase, partial [Chitinophagaceae bacterium]